MRSDEPRPRSGLIMRAHPLLLVGLGGAVGSLLRHGLVSATPNASVAVFFINVAGSLTLGAIAAWVQHAPPLGVTEQAHERWAGLLGLGLCGGLTTFSTHMVDVAQRLDSSWAAALFSLLGTAAATIAAAGLGYAAVRRTVQPRAAGLR